MSEPTGYDRKLDKDRLDKQMDVILALMLVASHGNSWLTLQEIHKLTEYGEASISAQLRNLRKAVNGGYVVEKRRRGKLSSGCWEYLVRQPVVEARGQLSFLANA